MDIHRAARHHDQSVCVALDCGKERPFKLIGMFHFQGLKPNRHVVGRGPYLFDLALGADNAWIHRIPTRESFGMACLISSRRLPVRSADRLVSPVTFPLGRAKLETKPRATGSSPAMTSGSCPWLASQRELVSPRP